MNWLFLIIAGLLEIGWAVGLKYTENFTRLWWTVGTALAMIVSFGLLSLSLRTIPLGTAYAVWTGIGAARTAALGMAIFGEPRSVLRCLCLVLVIAGIVGLKLVSPEGKE